MDAGRGAGVRQAAAALVDAKGEAVEEGQGAELAAVGAVAAAVEAAVQFQVDVLCELGVAQFALVRFLPRVEAQVCFQVAGAAEAFVTHLECMKRKVKASASNTLITGCLRKLNGLCYSGKTWTSFLMVLIV